MRAKDKCGYCGRTFGELDKDGLSVYEFDNKSGICTQCQVWDSRATSRQHDFQESYMANHGRRSGGPVNTY